MQKPLPYLIELFAIDGEPSHSDFFFDWNFFVYVMSFGLVLFFCLCFVLQLLFYFSFRWLSHRTRRCKSIERLFIEKRYTSFKHKNLTKTRSILGRVLFVFCYFFFVCGLKKKSVRQKTIEHKEAGRHTGCVRCVCISLCACVCVR